MSEESKTVGIDLTVTEKDPGTIEEMEIAYQDPTGVFWYHSDACVQEEFDGIWSDGFSF